MLGGAIFSMDNVSITMLHTISHTVFKENIYLLAVSQNDFKQIECVTYEFIKISILELL